MSKNNKQQIIQYVNKKGVLVTELCHDPLTCKKHSKRIRVNTGLSLSQLIAQNPLLFLEEETVEQALNVARFSDSRKELAVYANHNDPEVRAAVAQNMTTSPKIISQLALDEDDIVSSVALKDYRLPKKFFRKYGDASIYVRSLLAYNPSAPAKLIEAASRAQEFEIRKAAAGNYKASSNVLETLSLDSSEIVRSLVASNVNSNSATLDLLSKDPYPNVRKSVMSNHMASEVTIMSLSLDGNASVRNGIWSNGSPDIDNAKAIVSMQGGKIAKTIQDILDSKRN